MKRLALTVIAMAALLVAACSLTGAPDKRTCDWSPPEDGLINLGSPDFSNTRLWISPNPLAVPTDGGPSSLQMYMNRLGSESVIVEDVRIEGSPDFSTSFTVGRIFPYESGVDGGCCHSDGCGCCGFSGFQLEYAPSGVEPEPSWFVVETRGPGASTLRVPIILDHEGAYAPPEPIDQWGPEHVAAIAVNPNPVRFELGAPGDRQVQALCLTYTRGDILVTDFRIIGDGMRLINARDSAGSTASMATPFQVWEIDTVDVEFVSGASPVDGMLVISFINEQGKEMTLGVPVMTCE